MTNFLVQFQTIKNAFDSLIIAIEDVSDVWPVVKDGFQSRVPFKNACLHNRTHNSVFVENLPAEFILTTDARLRSRFLQEQSLFWFREPYATIILVTCEDLDEFKTILKPRLKLIIPNDEREWFIVFVSRAHPSDDQAWKLSKKIFVKIELEFSSKKRERCCKLDMYGFDASFWEDVESKIVESVRNTLDKRVQFYEEEIRKLSEQRFMPVWSFCNFFILKESLAFMFEMAHLYEDALREYDELEICYMETVNIHSSRHREFGGFDHGDDKAVLLSPKSKPLSLILQNDSFKEFEFRQYLFACQAKLLFKLSCPVEVAARGYSFIISFSKALALHENLLPFCLREVWVLTACLALINSTSSCYDSVHVPSDVDKEFHRLQGDLYSLSRIKFMRLAYLIGYGNDIERSPANSAALSMLPWPKPSVWPTVPPDASAAVLDKEKMILRASPGVKHFNIQRKPLTLEPSMLLRAANRRRASLSAGNAFEFVENRSSECSIVDGYFKSAPSKAQTNMMSRINSGPGSLENVSSVVDRPMRISEIHVAVEDTLKHTISDPEVWKWLSTHENFEKKYLELTRGAANNYHCSWWKRHGVALDGEIAAICFKHGNFDLAAKSYEKVCALYAGEGWQDLLAEVLPNLAYCQLILNDEAGYLSSCIRLLSLDRGLFLTKERQAFQSEVMRLAHSEMKHPLPLDVSLLISFSGIPGRPIELCDGDPGLLPVTIWSDFPDDIILESLSVTLIATTSLDEGEGVKAIRSSTAAMIKPGKNSIALDLSPQKPGSYVLGVLTGQIGYLRFRSHSFSKGGPSETDDFMSYEKPTRPVLKVFKTRPLVDIALVVSSALLINELQWVGLNIKPISYSLKGAILFIDTGPGLLIDESLMIQLEICKNELCEAQTQSPEAEDQGTSCVNKYTLLALENGKLELPSWASNTASILWFPVRATNNRLDTDPNSVYLQRQSIVNGMRTIATKLAFGIAHNQIFERTVAVHFTEPIHARTRIVDKHVDGILILQVTLHSQVKATLTIYDVWLDLQAGFVHIGNGGGRPMLNFFPFVISPSSRAGVVFNICHWASSEGDEIEEAHPYSILNIQYMISGDRTVGAHTPVVSTSIICDNGALINKIPILLQRPVLDPCLAVSFIPLQTDEFRVGHLVTVRWRVEWMKDFEEATNDLDELSYEVNADPIHWMVAGRKRGHVSLPRRKGSRVVISITCLPLVAAHIHPPGVCFKDFGKNVCCNTAGPQFVYVLPPVVGTSFCLPV